MKEAARGETKDNIAMTLFFLGFFQTLQWFAKIIKGDSRKSCNP